MKVLRSNFFWFLAILVGLLVILIVFMIKDNGNEPTILDEGSDPPVEQSDTVSDPTLIPTPVLWGDYGLGDRVEVTNPVSLCVFYRVDQEDCGYNPGHLFRGDVVEIIGEASLRNQNSGFGEPYWAWPATVIYGGIYVEDGQFWVPDSESSSSNVSDERPFPEFEVGDRVEVSYNFVLRHSPAGDAITYPESGVVELIEGGRDVTITAGPTLGPDGRYWCKVHSVHGQDGWIPCEFRWIP